MSSEILGESNEEYNNLVLNLDELESNALNVREHYIDKLVSQEIDPNIWKNFLEQYEGINLVLKKIVQDANWQLYLNQRNSFNKQIKQVTDDYCIRIMNILCFWEKELLKLNKVDILKLINSKELTTYNYFLQKQLEDKNLSGLNDEALLYDSIMQWENTIINLYDTMIGNYRFSILVDKKEQQLKFHQLIPLLLSDKLEKRKKARQSYFLRYLNDKELLESIYNSRIKQYSLKAKFYNCNSSIELNHKENQIDGDVILLLSNLIDENSDIVSNYYKWKSKQLNLQLSLSNIKEPIYKESIEYPWEYGKQITLESYQDFDFEVGKIVIDIIKDQRIDYRSKDGKISGARCLAYVPDYKPHILMNYGGKLEDVLTLAHEIGHGVHKTLASKQNYLNYSPSLILGEVASLFGEILVFQSMLEQENDVMRKRLLLSKRIESILYIIFNMNVITKFEMNIHDYVNKHGYCEFDKMSSIYLNELNLLYKDSLCIEEYDKYTWLMIPHILKTPFYAYVYSFSNLLALSMYAKYKNDSKVFVDKFKRLLESGCSKTPNYLLTEMGINIYDKDYWQKGFDDLRKYINQLISFN
ncbi:M3 family metallopeptidase [Vallitalea maricola]|uniref:M3 family oligoendopeptidase n=1 Tax=Vallitalea maricola TaxID=3074433 RepID=A0ACB5UMW3_9FIRM|nr:M3 family oligoendopeptidase [Vallitalea sp. AN17-2]